MTARALRLGQAEGTGRGRSLCSRRRQGGRWTTVLLGQQKWKKAFPSTAPSSFLPSFPPVSTIGLEDQGKEGRRHHLQRPAREGSLAAVVATFTGKSRFCRVAWWTADPGSADGKGGRRGRRRRDEKRRSTHLHQSDWLSRSLSRSALFHSFPWNKGRKEKSSNQKKRNYKTKQVQSIKLEEDRALGRNF